MVFRFRSFDLVFFLLKMYRVFKNIVQRSFMKCYWTFYWIRRKYHTFQCNPIFFNMLLRFERLFFFKFLFEDSKDPVLPNFTHTHQILRKIDAHSPGKHIIRGYRSNNQFLFYICISLCFIICLCSTSTAIKFRATNQLNFNVVYVYVMYALQSNFNSSL